MPPDPIAEAHHALVRTLARVQVSAGPVQALGLQFTPISWEDSGRTSAVDPDLHMTLEVHSRHHGQRHGTPMQVLRHHDFHHRTAELPLAALRLQVGNHRGEPSRGVTLREYLGDLRAHLTHPGSWPGATTSLLAARDSHALVRAQACLLPVSQAGLASFTPVLHDDRSRVGTPAVLAILAAREGTSATVVVRPRGQRLLLNRAGQRAPLTASRTDLSPGTDPDNLTSRTGPNSAHLPASTGPDRVETRAVLLIQVPLRRPAPPPDRFAHLEIFPSEPERGYSGMEPAVLVPGAVEGPFVEIDGPIERDDRLPIRLTVQFYRAVREPDLADDDIIELGAQIERALADPAAIGSLLAEVR